ncbi:MAG: hypothetical protein R2769_17555 [Saprospiraceae bacterium]
MELQLLLSVLGGIGVLLALIIWLRITPFIALLIAGILTGLFAGMEVASIMDTVIKSAWLPPWVISYDNCRFGSHFLRNFGKIRGSAVRFAKALLKNLEP